MLQNRLPKVKGTKKLIFKNQLLISLGLSSLDSIIGGGLPIGSTLLLEEDEYGIYSKTILKHYLSEGILSNHALLIGSQDIDTKKFIKDLPAPINPTQSIEKSNLPNVDELRIAWRYQNLPNNNIVDKYINVFGNTYDLSTRIEKSILENADISHWNPNPGKYSYDDLFAYIQNAVSDSKFIFDVPVENRNLLRIVLHSLGTALWEGDIVKFLIKLRFLTRNTCTSCIITVSPHLFEHAHILQRCEHLCDTVIRLNSLANDGNPAYSDYDGLLVLKKLPVINSWNSYIPENNDWAFKAKKRSFVVEELHISPEFKERVHREEEDVSNEYETRKYVPNIAQQF